MKVLMSLMSTQVIWPWEPFLEPVPTLPDLGGDSDAHSNVKAGLGKPFPVFSKRRRCNCQRDVDVQQPLDPWTSTFLAERQAEDEDLSQVQNWLRTQTVPDWDDLQPSVQQRIHLHSYCLMCIH